MVRGDASASEAFEAFENDCRKQCPVGVAVPHALESRSHDGSVVVQAKKPAEHDRFADDVEGTL
jgi:hypothetical protein